MTEECSEYAEPVDGLSFATVLEIDGAHVIAELDTVISELTRVHNGCIYPIGQFGSIVKIHFGRTQIFGYVSRLRMKTDYDRERGLTPTESTSERIIEVDLFGEGRWVKHSGNSGEWTLQFERGVSTFPLPQQKVHLTQRNELKFIYGRETGAAMIIGEHVGSAGTPAYADINEMLCKHTAILGSTGSGKSGTVAYLLHGIINRGKDLSLKEWNPRIVILDPHNEYGEAFADCRCVATDDGTLSLPYWLLDFEETLSLVVGKTEFVATSQSNILKNALLDARREGAKALGIAQDEIDTLTVDSPFPYELGVTRDLDDFGLAEGVPKLAGLAGAVNKQRPQNQNRSQHEEFNKIIRKLDTLRSDGRLDFMMKEWTSASDELSKVVEQFFCNDTFVITVDMSGTPNEVAGIASSAIARLLFSVKLWQTPDERGKNPILLVCEEAHRYVPDKGEAQYGAAQQAIQRLAKEGRKYGIGLMLVSQRPSEVDATVLSQCNSWFVLRITNERDRDHVRAVLPDSMTSLVKSLSGLRRREAIVVGQATTLPSRVLIGKLTADQLPKSNDISFCDGWQCAPLASRDISKVAERWRFQRRV